MSNVSKSCSHTPSHTSLYWTIDSPGDLDVDFVGELRPGVPVILIKGVLHRHHGVLPDIAQVPGVPQNITFKMVKICC